MTSLKSYICIYHEAAITNLLEVMLYHRTAISSNEDAVVELIDYCYRKMVRMTTMEAEYKRRQTEKPPVPDAKTLLNRTQK